ncbi:TetR/AcrR family transcriptional regulator C-terminal domain-containing protein [Egicoccus halophilus]|uniref:TetR family transcriptional regulator n=1 Tax=Egicoccus halophilus TaxID=1670830 RepID=A0A8J3EZ78_9ACTN|nr:TetR/AcrR family transcriptional regulator C-terminal domain-containing protein [Egicoccus halophilus]GGI09377.1 TetR family transcriptional regulator [Egicoccus halophilus]
MPQTTRESEIVAAALELLDAQGVEGVTLRAVARRLGVHLNTVSWHVKTKHRLLQLTADGALAEVSLDDLPSDWDGRLRVLLGRYRAALLAHRDGARLMAGTYAAEPHTLRLAEAVVGTLLEAGLGEREAAWSCWTLIYFTLGLTQEEQDAPAAGGAELDDALSPADHPALHRVLPHLAVGSFAERYEFGLDLVIASLRRRVPSADRAGPHAG